MALQRMRVRKPTRLILDALARANPGAPMWGYRIWAETGLALGTIYPQLELLEAAGHVRGYREASAAAGRPRRRLYELTDTGHELAVEAQTVLARRFAVPGGGLRAALDSFAGMVRGR